MIPVRTKIRKKQWILLGEFHGNQIDHTHTLTQELPRTSGIVCFFFKNSGSSWVSHKQEGIQSEQRDHFGRTCRVLSRALAVCLDWFICAASQRSHRNHGSFWVSPEKNPDDLVIVRNLTTKTLGTKKHALKRSLKGCSPFLLGLRITEVALETMG